MCKRENEGNEQQRELEVVFAQLVAIDRARNSAEVDLAVNTLLQAIGEYTQAERTYIFEMMEEERIFTNIYEWCSEGVTPQIDNLQALTADDMPVWYRIFLRGESIIIDDLETVKESMPLEYDILKAQDIYSEISFPIWYRGKLMGFIGVDNPRVAKSRYFLNLLAVVGGYVGNAWENFRVARQLKQNRDALQQNRRDLEKAREEVTLNNEIISAISKIYVLIFRIDLEKDYYDEISSQDELHRLTGKHGRASARMQEICDAFVASGYRENVRQFLDLSTLAGRLGEEDTVGMEYLTQDGDWHLARFIVKNRNAAGEVTHVLYVTRVISDTKRREQSWIAIAEEANRANMAKTEFLSRMAHDIRTPMNAIQGFTTIAKASPNNVQKVEECLQKIEISSHYLRELADNILDLTHIESGQMKAAHQEMQLTSFFAELCLLVDGICIGRSLRFEKCLHDIRYERIVADPVLLRQIYMNLLSNAVKYTSDGGTVTLEMYEEMLPGTNRIRLVSRVQDSGIGMSREYMDVMYAKFSRAVDTRVNQVRGSGLGLSVVKELTDLLGGQVQVESAPEQGTKFMLSFTFPYVDAAEVPARAGQEEDVAEACKGMHLLVAEDNDLNYEVASELLAMQGISCDRAENGAACVERFQHAPEGTYNAILMDMQMPVMDGVQATETIRHMTRRDAVTIPIIAMTANAFQQDVASCMNAGMNGHLAKPFDLAKLLPMLADACRRQVRTEK